MPYPTPSQADLRRLAIPLPLLPGESGLSFLLRSFAANGVSLAQGSQWLGLDRRLPMTRRQLLAMAWALNADGERLAQRWPVLEDGRLREWVHLAGHRFSRWIAPTKPHARLCPACLREGRGAHVLWQLRCATLCPWHRTTLVSRCATCRQKTVWDRPDVDVCGCGRHFPVEASAEGSVNPAALAWHRWVVKRMFEDQYADERWPHPLLPAVLDGLSIDGAYRIIDAFGVLPETASVVRAVRPARDDFCGAHVILERGIERLRHLELGQAPASEIFARVNVAGLQALMHKAATPADSLCASWLVEAHRGGQPTGRVGSRPRQQLPLFL